MYYTSTESLNINHAYIVKKLDSIQLQESTKYGGGLAMPATSTQMLGI